MWPVAEGGFLRSEATAAWRNVIVGSGRARQALLAGLVGAGLAAAGVGRPLLLATLTGLLFCALCLIVVFRRGLADGRRHLFSPVVLLSGYLLLGIGVRGLTTLAGGANKIEGGVDPTSAEFHWLYTSVFLYAFLGLAAFLLGDAVAARLLPPSRSPMDPGTRSYPRRAILAGLGLGVFAALILIARLGTTILRDPAFVATTGTFGLFWLYPLLSAPLYGLAFAFADG